MQHVFKNTKWNAYNWFFPICITYQWLKSAHIYFTEKSGDMLYTAALDIHTHTWDRYLLEKGGRTQVIIFSSHLSKLCACPISRVWNILSLIWGWSYAVLWLHSIRAPMDLTIWWEHKSIEHQARLWLVDLYSSGSITNQRSGLQLTYTWSGPHLSSIDLQWHTSRFLDLIILHNASDLGNLFDGFQIKFTLSSFGLQSVKVNQ